MHPYFKHVLTEELKAGVCFRNSNVDRSQSTSAILSQNVFRGKCSEVFSVRVADQSFPCRNNNFHHTEAAHAFRCFYESLLALSSVLFLLAQAADYLCSVQLKVIVL